MNIVDWGNVLLVVKELNYLNSLEYFDLEKFCRAKGVDYIEISHFLKVANSIINRESEILGLLKQEKKLVKQLESLDLSDFSLT